MGSECGEDGRRQPQAGRQAEALGGEAGGRRAREQEPKGAGGSNRHSAGALEGSVYRWQAGAWGARPG